MAKETEKRLIRTLEFLKEPKGSTIPTIVKAMKSEGQDVSLKRIVQTLRGCQESGIVKVSDGGRVKLRQVDFEPAAQGGGHFEDSNMKKRSACMKPNCPNKPCPMKVPKCPPKKQKPKCPKSRPDDDDEENDAEGEGEGEGEGEENGNIGEDVDKSKCPPCPKPKKSKACRRKRRGAKSKKKGKCAKPKKKQPKCKKQKPKKCAPKKKIQPYCKKKKKECAI